MSSMNRELPSEKIRRQITLSSYLRTKFPSLKMSSSGGRGQYRCACPIHDSSNSSTFSIDDDKGYWKCFGGCGSGSVIDLWLKLNDRSESDAMLAMEELAKEASIDLGNKDSNHDNRKLSKHQLSRVVEAICDAAHQRLMDRGSSLAEEAYEYLTSRKLDDDDLKSWNIGMFPGRKTAVKWMIGIAKEIVGDRSKEALEDIFFIEKSQYDEKETYTQFADRIIFPIRDDRGSYVGVSARIAPSHENEKKKDGKKKSKYVNSRGSELFDKSSVMYGAHNLSRHGKNKTSTAFICEGQMDVISLNWILNDDEIAVATCGTSLTEQHMQWIGGSFKSINVMFDSDDAGQQAMVKALPLVNFLSSSHIHAVTLSSGKDANEIASRSEDDLIDDLDAGESDFVDAVALALWRSVDESPQRLIAVARDAIGGITRSVERQKLVKALENASGLREEDITRDIVMSVTPKKRRRSSDDENVSAQLVPLAAWLSKLDTSSRSSILCDMDSWLESNFLSETILGVSSETDRIVLYFLSIGHEMSETYSSAQTERAEQLVADLMTEKNDNPDGHFIKIARLLLNEIRGRRLDRVHAPFLTDVIAGKTQLSRESLFSQLSDVINEVV